MAEHGRAARQELKLELEAEAIEAWCLVTCSHRLILSFLREPKAACLGNGAALPGYSHISH